MYETDKESQTPMKPQSALPPVRSRISAWAAFALTASMAAFCGQAARAQSAAPTQQANPLRAVTDFLRITTDPGEAPDFVRATRPDVDKLGYSHLTGVDKPRIPVKTPEQVEASRADLVAARAKAEGRRKKLADEKLAPVAPSAPPPPMTDKF